MAVEQIPPPSWRVGRYMPASALRRGTRTYRHYAGGICWAADCLTASAAGLNPPPFAARQRAIDLARECVRDDPDTDVFRLARGLILADLDAAQYRDVIVAMLELVGFLACLPAEQLSDIPIVRLDTVREILAGIGLR